MPSPANGWHGTILGTHPHYLEETSVKKPRLRTSDGKPQFKSVDDLLKEAASPEAIAGLPGKGKPLDLRGYFESGEEYRIAAKILMDNKVLPTHLQDRKDAEDLLEKAERFLTEAKQQIPGLRSQVLKRLEMLASVFPDRETCQLCLGFDTWPDEVAEPKATGIPPELKQLNESTRTLARDITRYNARVDNTSYRYLGLLKMAQEKIDQYHKHQQLTTSLSPRYNGLNPLNLDRAAQELCREFPLIPRLPGDLPSRLKSWHRKTRSPFSSFFKLANFTRQAILSK
jgi:hypothetical protein